MYDVQNPSAEIQAPSGSGAVSILASK